MQRLTAALAGGCLAVAGATLAAPATASADTAPTSTSHTTADTTQTPAAGTPRSARAHLHSSSGTHVGTAWFRDTRHGTEVRVQARWIKPGFHGLHIHAIGKCEKNSANPTDPSETGAFLSAGGHWSKTAGTDHPMHTGDLGVIYAGKNTRASITTVTDRFKVADLFDRDGSALMIHQGSDNFANIPERYDPSPDEETRRTGDAGSRAACGVARR